jgi:hypothetical protein
MIPVDKDIYNELIQARQIYVKDLGFEDFANTLFNDLDYLINKLAFIGFRRAYTWATMNRSEFAQGMAQGFAIRNERV